MKKIVATIVFFSATSAWSLGLWLEPHLGYSFGNVKQPYSINGGFYTDDTTSSQRTISSSNNGIDFGGKIGAYQKVVPQLIALSLGAYLNASSMSATPDATLYSAGASYDLLTRLGVYINADLPWISVWGAYMPLASIPITNVSGLGTSGKVTFEGYGFAVGIAYTVFKGLKINLTYHGEVYTKGQGLASVNTSNSSELKSLPAVTTNSSITRRYDEISAYRLGISVSYALILFD